MVRYGSCIVQNYPVIPKSETILRSTSVFLSMKNQFAKHLSAAIYRKDNAMTRCSFLLWIKPYQIIRADASAKRVC